jgi:hypothetical protein
LKRAVKMTANARRGLPRVETKFKDTIPAASCDISCALQYHVKQ